MTTTTEKLLAQAKVASVDQALQVATQLRSNFLVLFGSFIRADDLLKIDQLLVDAIKFKAAQYTAATDAIAQEAVDNYEACLDTVQTIADQYEIVGKAKAGVFVRSVAHELISGAFAVAGAVLQAGLGIALPGVGSLIGAGVNAGLQHVVAYFNGA